MSKFIEVVENKIGFPLSHSKSIEPDQIIDYVGLTTALKCMCISLPEDKYQKAG